jgi:outer membrane cobalamin receptor
MVLGTYTAASAQLPSANRDAGVTLDPLVVTGEWPPTPLSLTTSQVTVMQRDRIGARQADSVTDVLRQVPGLHIDQPGARGGVSSVYLRGADPSLTMVLIDGFKVNDLTNNRGGSFDFSTLNTDDIERIEIVPGPLSAVYGSDALSGVINIITRRGSPQSSRQIELAGGRFGYLRTRLQAQGQLGDLDYALSGAYLDNGEPVEGSDFRNGTWHANIGLPLSDLMEVRGLARYSRSTSTVFPDASGGPDLAVLRETEKREIEEVVVGMTLDHEPLDWWTYKLQFGLFHRQEESVSPGVAPPPDNPFAGIPGSESDATFQRFEVTLAHTLTPLDGVNVTLGAQAQFEDGTNRGSLTFIGPTNFDFSRDTYAPFLHVQLTLLPGLRVQGGLRADFVEDFDYEISPRVGVAYTIAATGTTLRANWGEGFKVPSFYSLADPVVGNMALVPETSMSAEVGLTQPLGSERITLRLGFFYNQFDNLIDFDPTIFRLVNREDVETKGVEMQLQVQPWPALRFNSHLTYVDTDIKGDSMAALRNRPRWRGGLDLHWNAFPTLSLNLALLVVGDSLDFAVPTGERELDAYARVDLAATWTFRPNWDLFFAVDNVLDADYQEAIGFPAPGINPRGGVRARF